MQEADRRRRNTEKLAECFPAYASPLKRVLDAMEAQGFRPRIQDAWRSEEDQIKAFEAGNSGLRFGFHNCTGSNGAKEALACDVLDDDQPLASRKRYLLALTRAARQEGLQTGILWKLKPEDIGPVEAALAAGDLDADVRIGFDPTHVEVKGLTVAEARAGQRPTSKDAPHVPAAALGLPPEFSYIVDNEDWLWLGAERIHARCAVGAVLESLKTSNQVTALGRKEPEFHRFLLGMAKDAGFTG